jgi:hypothetical protein
MGQLAGFILLDRRRKSAVNPVIATIILISGTLVLALVVGAYTYGLFGSNVKSLTLASATLYGGESANQTLPATSSLVFAIDNPGSATYVTGVTLSGSDISTILAWDNSTAPSSVTNLILFDSSHAGNNAVAAGTVTSFAIHPETAIQENIATGQVFDYVVNFANGQSISGSLVGQ